MKRIILAILLGFLLLFPIQLKAEMIISSGLTTTDRLIATGNCLLYGYVIVSGASTAVLSIYDALTISGTTVLKGGASIAQVWGGVSLVHPIEVFTGIYADVTGTGAAYTIFYKCK